MHAGSLYLFQAVPAPDEEGFQLAEMTAAPVLSNTLGASGDTENLGLQI